MIKHLFFNGGFSYKNRRCFVAVLCCCILFSSLCLNTAMAQIQITDSHGKYRFSQAPKRVVALNWALAEQMLELGVVPIGMADINGFRRHSNKPTIPSTVIDVGDRLNPDLKQVKTLQPDIILIGYSQRSLVRSLSNIATVIYFKNFGKRYNNEQKSQSRFIELAQLFDKRKVAEQLLHKRNLALNELRKSITSAYQGSQLPTIQILVPTTHFSQSYAVFGYNSMPYYAAQKLGLAVLGGEKVDGFGVSQLSEQRLTQLSENIGKPICRFYLSSYVKSIESINYPKSESSCSSQLEYQNAFGGVMSILYLAKAMQSALLKHKSKNP